MSLASSNRFRVFICFFSKFPKFRLLSFDCRHNPISRDVVRSQKILTSPLFVYFLPFHSSLFTPISLTWAITFHSKRNQPQPCPSRYAILISQAPPTKHVILKTCPPIPTASIPGGEPSTQKASSLSHHGSPPSPSSATRTRDPDLYPPKSAPTTPSLTNSTRTTTAPAPYLPSSRFPSSADVSHLPSIQRTSAASPILKR